MSRKDYWVETTKYISHNFLSIRGKESGIKVYSILTLGRDSKEIELSSGLIEINKVTVIRYSTVISNRIKITIDHPLSDTLSLYDLVDIQVGLDEYETQGSYKSENEEISFNKYLTVVSDVKNSLDSLVDLKVYISTIDRYGAIIYSDSIGVSINDDGWMINKIDDSGIITLEYLPSEEDIYIQIGDNKIKPDSIEGKIVKIDIPEGYIAYVIYRPDFLEKGINTELSKNITITPSYGLILREDYCSKIIFSIELNIYNLEETLENHTPIIKSLGLMTADR